MPDHEHFDAIKRATSVPFQAHALRISIIVSYVAVLLAGVPIWWYMTSITRLPLPKARVEAIDWTESLKFPLDLVIARTESRESNAASGPSGADIERAILARRRQSDSHWRGLDVRLHTRESSNTPEAFSIALADYPPGSAHFVGDNSLSVSGASASVDQVVDVLSDLVTPYTSARQEADDQRVAKYSPRYRLSFTLLNEDVSTSGFRAWEVEHAIHEYFEPTLRQLRTLHEFDIETQVQYYAPLAFEPEQAEDDEGQPIAVLTSEELKVFVNSAEWSLASSVTPDPVLHFILFVPSARHRPLHVINSRDAIAQSNAFLIPQWGGVVVLNAGEPEATLDVSGLLPIFRTFHAHLQLLLGVPGHPPGTTHVPTSRDTPLTRWQLSALMRARIRENAREATNALRSTVSLVSRIGQMPVREDVRSIVHAALDDLDQLRVASDLRTAFGKARDAASQASAAFFHPGMLAMLYFPPEHTYAVYTPLFVPVLVPLLSGIMREVKRIRKERERERKRKEKGKARMDGERTE